VSRLKGVGKIAEVQTINDWILVEKLEEENITASGIQLPRSKNEQVKFARVIQISPYVPVLSEQEDNDKLRYKEGDIIAYHEKLGIEVVDPQDETRKLEFMKWTGMMAIIKIEEDKGEEG